MNQIGTISKYWSASMSPSSLFLIEPSARRHRTTTQSAQAPNQRLIPRKTTGQFIFIFNPPWSKVVITVWLISPIHLMKHYKMKLSFAWSRKYFYHTFICTVILEMERVMKLSNTSKINGRNKYMICNLLTSKNTEWYVKHFCTLGLKCSAIGRWISCV